MPSSPKNYPFYNWVPKPVGIIILFVFFLPILTVGGTYSVASTEMMSGLGIISEHIQSCQLRHFHRYGGILSLSV